LHVLTIAVEAGTFNAAAQLLNISQPAVSTHIHRIESELGIEIFERPYSRKLHLTKAGQLVHAYAIEVLAKNKDLKKETSELMRGEMGEIKFALSVGRCIIPSIIVDYQKKYPKVFFIVRSGNSDRIQKLVINGEVVFGLSLFTDNPQIIAKPLYSEPIVMVCSADHPLASKKNVSKVDLDKYGLFTGLKESQYNRYFYNSLAAIGIYNVRVLSQIEEQEIVLKIVKKGGGISLVNQSTVQEAIEKKEMVKLSYANELKLPRIQAYQLFRPGTRLNATEQLFFDFLRTELPKRFPYITLV